MVDAASNEKITIYTYSEVEKVSGFVGDFTVDIRKKARSVDMDKCTGCGVCQEKCPSKKIPSEFNRGLGNRTAIYTPFAQAIPNVPVIDRENCCLLYTSYTSNGSLAVDGSVFTSPGVYHYLVTEVSGDYEGMDYDNSTYDVYLYCLLYTSRCV